MVKNTIQVYGLPRSGTNFLEWSLKQYFEDITYKNIYSINNVSGIKGYKSEDAVKHSYPSFEYSNKVIVIYKEYDKWEKSYLKYTGFKKVNRQVWENYLKTAKELDNNNCILINHHDLYTNYKDNLIMISKKFNLKLKNIEIIQPERRFDKGGADSQPKFNKYIHE